MRKLIILTALLLFAGIAFGQTFQKGAVCYISTQTVELKDYVTMSQYMDFMTNTYIPEMEKLFPGTKLFMMKKDQREITSDILSVWYFPSEALRDKYLSEGFVIKDSAITPKVFKLGGMLEEYGTSKGTGSKEWIVL